jgi:hypothetical protein
LGQEQDEQTPGRETSDPWLRLYIYIYIYVNHLKDIPLGVCEACSFQKSETDDVISLSLSLSLFSNCP